MFDYNTLPESLKRSNAKEYHCCCEVASVVSDSVRPQRWQPTRLCHPWDSPGKNTGMGCHFLLQCMKVKSEREVAQSCPTLSDPMDCSPPDFSIRGSFQARVLEWGAIAFSERISQTSSNTEGRKETEKETEEGKEKRERKKDSNVKTTALFFNISDRINIQDDHWFSPEL